MSKTRTGKRQTAPDQAIAYGLLGLAMQSIPGEDAEIHSERLLRRLRRIKNTLCKLRPRGGLVVVSENDTLITTYAMDQTGWNRPHRTRHIRQWH